MPYPNEHAARVRDPGDFVRIRQLWSRDGVRELGGPLKSDPNGPIHAQAYRFDKDRFTVAKAKKWLKDHDVHYIAFEPASGKEAASMSDKLKFLTTPADMLGDVVKSVDEKAGIIVSHPTIEIEDRDGDIVRVGDGKETGLLLTEYRKNPVGLWQHGHDARGMTPVFTTTDIQPVTVKRHKALEFTEKWDIEAPDDPFPRVIFRMHATNPPMLRARSIRFFPLESSERDASGGWKGYDFTKSDLRENSAVAIGANPLALAVAVKAEVCDAAFLVEHGILKGMVEADQTLGIMRELLGDEVQAKIDAAVEAFEADFEKRLHALEPEPDALTKLFKLMAQTK